MALIKYDYILRENSPLSLTQAQTIVLEELDRLQASTQDWLYADLFDPASGKLFRLYSAHTVTQLGVNAALYELSGSSPPRITGQSISVTSSGLQQPSSTTAEIAQPVQQQSDSVRPSGGYYGIDRQTGRAISGLDHLRASIQEILTTPKGTKVMNRTYGSQVPALLGSALNTPGVLTLKNAIATALYRHEPRLKLHKIQISMNKTGQTRLQLNGQIQQQRLDLEVVL